MWSLFGDERFHRKQLMLVSLDTCFQFILLEDLYRGIWAGSSAINLTTWLPYSWRIKVAVSSCASHFGSLCRENMLVFKQILINSSDKKDAGWENGPGSSGAGTQRCQHHRCGGKHTYCQFVWPHGENMEPWPAAQEGNISSSFLLLPFHSKAVVMQHKKVTSVLCSYCYHFIQKQW